MSEAGRQAAVELGIHSSAPFSIQVEGETLCYQAYIAETLVVHR